MAFGQKRKAREVVGGKAAAVADKPERISNKLQHVLVAEDRPVSRTVRYKKRVKALAGTKKYRKAAAIAAGGFLVVFVAAAFLLRDNPQPVVDDGPKCSYATLEKSKKLLEPRKADQLHTVVQEVENTPGYDQDVNCLYVTLTYYINIGDATKARELYNKLANVYDPGEGYETVIVDVALTPDKLKPQVEFLEKQAASYQHVDFKTGAAQ